MSAQSIHASVPGKLILCGEHAVVYQRPAIAIPVAGVRATATLTPTRPGSGLCFEAPDLERSWATNQTPDDPITQVAMATLAMLQVPTPDAVVHITSEIPIASGMGSGAAIATAVVRVLALAHQQAISAAQVSALVYESEKRYHGTPSGIDNTVVAYEQPIVYTRRGTPQQPLPALIEPLTISSPFTLLIADSGVRSATHRPVGDLRQRWQRDPQHYEAMFDQVGTVVNAVRAALNSGNLSALGPLLNQNQHLLQELGISSPELDQLVDAARAAGALGAKLSGAGWGGVIIALIRDTMVARVQTALYQAGATRVLQTRVG